MYNNRLLSGLAFLFLVLHPVIYAHSFFNSKDVPFLSVMIIGFYWFHRAFEKQNWRSAAVLGAVAGLMISIRLTGLFFMASIILFFLLNVLRAPDKKKVTLHAGLFLITVMLTLYVTYPLLWKNPVENFKWVFTVMADYPFEGTLLFKGRFITAPQLPWYFIPFWFTVSTPLLFLLAGLAGLIICAVHSVQIFAGQLGGIRFYNLFFLINFIFPVVAVIVLDSVVYDGWRHMFFIYPAFVLMVVAAFNTLMQKKGQVITAVIVLVVLSPTIFFMIRNHPLQFIHFNLLVDRKTPEHLRSQYELDYWGVAYKQGLEIILRHDTSSRIKISSQNPPCDLNLELLPDKDRKRFIFTVIEDSDYFLTNYRWHPQDYEERSLSKKEWKSVTVQNNAVNMIYKLKKE
jgi:hypothetical protein